MLGFQSSGLWVKWLAIHVPPPCLLLVGGDRDEFFSHLLEGTGQALSTLALQFVMRGCLWWGCENCAVGYKRWEQKKGFSWEKCRAGAWCRAMRVRYMRCPEVSLVSIFWGCPEVCYDLPEEAGGKGWDVIVVVWNWKLSTKIKLRFVKSISVTLIPNLILSFDASSS